MHPFNATHQIAKFQCNDASHKDPSEAFFSREVFGPPRLDGQRVDDMEISEIYRVNSSNFFNVINKICGFWVFHGFPSEFWSPFGHQNRCLDRAFFITRALLMTCGKNIFPAPKRSPMMPMPRPDGLCGGCAVVDGVVSCFQRVPEIISGSTWNRHPLRRVKSDGQIQALRKPKNWLVISFHLQL